MGALGALCGRGFGGAVGIRLRSARAKSRSGRGMSGSSGFHVRCSSTATRSCTTPSRRRSFSTAAATWPACPRSSTHCPSRTRRSIGASNRRAQRRALSTAATNGVVAGGRRLVRRASCLRQWTGFRLTSTTRRRGRASSFLAASCRTGRTQTACADRSAPFRVCRHTVGQRLPPACLGLAAHPSHRAQGFACSYELDYTALRWTQKVVAGSLPDGRASHAAAIFAPGGQASGLVVWGGSNAQLLQDLWLFEFTSGTWLQLPCARRRQHGPMPPPARAAAAF